MSHWIDDLDELLDRNERCVLVTVSRVRGSAPREAGAKMIVTANETVGTIGGGQLEYQCSKIAVKMLRDGNHNSDSFTRKFPLGANCGQCCGGVVDILFEPIEQSSRDWFDVIRRLDNERVPAVLATSINSPNDKLIFHGASGQKVFGLDACPAGAAVFATNILANENTALHWENYFFEPIQTSQFNVAVFGAGHVGTACVDVLSRLDISIRWIESRKNMLPEQLPRNVTAIEVEDPVREIAAVPAGSFYLIVTHSHPLDLELSMRVLRREDHAYCGLIGSRSKRRRFERLMRKQGITEAALKRLTCPIGVAGIEGKKPVEIALSVSAQMLQVRDGLKRSLQGGDSQAVVDLASSNIRAV